MIEFRFCEECEKIFGGGAKCPHCGSRLELKEPAFFIGQSFGKYSVEGILGHGGMGMVYLARHSVLGRLAALKIILPELGEEGDTFLARFLREAQLLAQLKHRGIVDIYDFDVSHWGLPYYAMEFVEGISLRSLLVQYGKLFALDDYSDIFKDIASALDYAHEKGVVHRDLKPENIIIALSEGKPAAKILDFGIAKIMAEGEAGKTLTGEGNVIGTLNYIAPEQVLGGKISPRTDQYAFALIVAEILSGKAVREGKTLGEICATEIQASLKAERLPESAPESVRDAIRKATEKDPEQRFGKVSDFVSALGLKAPEKSEKLVSIIQRETAGCSPTITPIPSKAVISKLTPGKVSKKTKVSEEKEPSPPEKKKKGWLKYAVLGTAAFAVLGMSWLLFFNKPKKSSEPEKKELAVCEKTGEWSIPPDSSAVISCVDGRTALLKGGRSLYLVNLSSNQMPTMVPLAAGEEVLGTAPAGDPVIYKPAANGAEVVERSVSESKEKLLFSFASARPGSVMISRSLRTAALRTGTRVATYSQFMDKLTPLAAIDNPEASSEGGICALSDSYFAAYWNDRLFVYDARTGANLFRKDLKEKVYGLYIDDASGKLALWGWFDRINIYSLPDGAVSEIKVAGETKDVIVIPDKPTLAAAGNYGVKFWDFATSKLLFESSAEESYSSLFFSPTGIFAVSAGKGTMSKYALRSVFPARTAKVCDKELWSLADDPKEKKVFAGGADGKIYIIPESGEVTSKELHTLGVTSIVLSGDTMISASDDKTIAVFKMPSLELQYRSTAHTFLINHLLLSGSPARLWSSSSDGSLKSWTLPNLQEQFSVSITELLGKKHSLHGFWISPEADRMVIGTWNNELVYLKKEGTGGFKPRVFDIASRAGICVSEIKGRDLIAIAGVNDRSAVYIFDLRTEELYLLPEITGSPYTFSVFPSGEDGTVLLCPFGEIVRLKFDRGADGRISYSSSLWLSPEIACTGIAVLSSDGNSVITATDTGEILWIGLKSLGAANESKGFLAERITPRAD